MISPLTMSASAAGAHRVLTVTGRVDHTNAQSFMDQLAVQTSDLGPGSGLVVDLGGLDFITSAGLRGLMLARKTLGPPRLVVTGIAGTVAEVFRISKFDTLLTVTDTVDAAVARLGG